MSYVIALEGGATHTRAGLYDEDGALAREASGGPANPIAYGVYACARNVQKLMRELLGDISPAETSVYAAFAGAADASVQRDMAKAIGTRLRLRRVLVTSDLHAMLHANAGAGSGILVIAGTGAAVLGRDADGCLLRAGGWGTLLGDEGSGYAIAAAALRACARAVDCVALNTSLVERLTKAAGLNAFDEFVSWSARAGKKDIAALTPAVVAAAEEGDIVARSCIDEEAYRLAALALVVQERLDLETDGRLFEYGALLDACDFFRNAFRAATANYGEMQHLPCKLRGHRAVFELTSLERPPKWTQVWRNTDANAGAALPATEQSADAVYIDELSPHELAAAMNRGDCDVAPAVGEVLDGIAEAIDCAARCLRAGGRIIYVGAGTSGRLGVLDASECPPTFGVPPERVVGLMAGGDRALRESVEGAEDSAEQGASDLAALNVTENDFVGGIAASGGTPYVLGALQTARAAGATTVLITSNPSANAVVDILIVPDTGPELLPGSTRLKAGTAAKMILNMISTGAMAQAGYVYKGRMVGMTPVNEKLLARARRIVAEIADIEDSQAAALLDASGHHIATAILMAEHGTDKVEATALLRKHEGRLRDALESD